MLVRGFADFVNFVQLTLMSLSLGKCCCNTTVHGNYPPKTRVVPGQFLQVNIFFVFTTKNADNNPTILSLHLNYKTLVKYLATLLTDKVQASNVLPVPVTCLIL